MVGTMFDSLCMSLCVHIAVSTRPPSTTLPPGRRYALFLYLRTQQNIVNFVPIPLCESCACRRWRIHNTLHMHTFNSSSAISSPQQFEVFAVKATTWTQGRHVAMLSQPTEVHLYKWRNIRSCIDENYSLCILCVPMCVFINTVSFMSVQPQSV